MAKRLKSSNTDSNNELPVAFNIYDANNYHKVMMNIPTEPIIAVLIVGEVSVLFVRV